MILFSPAFADGAELPFECAYDSENRSPAIQWIEPPLGTACFALSCEDPEGVNGAPWTHWTVWNIPGNESRLLPGQPPYGALENGASQGLNDFLELGWGGPCPPNGRHSYVFTLYALDAVIRPTAPTRAAFDEALRGRVLEAAAITAYHDRDNFLGSYEALRLAKRPGGHPIKSA